MGKKDRNRKTERRAHKRKAQKGRFYDGNVYVLTTRPGKMALLADDRGDGMVFATTRPGLISKLKQAGEAVLGTPCSAEPVPGTDFLGGVLSTLPQMGAHILNFPAEQDQMLPLSRQGAAMITAVERGGYWSSLNDNERVREVVRRIMSLIQGVNIPSLEDAAAAAAQPESGRPVETHTAVMDLHELTRAANFRRDYWLSKPTPGRHLVKVQKPLAGTGSQQDHAPMCVYNEDKTLFVFVSDPERERVLRKALGSGVKGFLWASVEGNTISFDHTPQADPGW